MIGAVRSLLGGADDTPAVPHSSLDVGTAFDLLRNGRRRRVVEYVATHDDGDGVTISDLARSLAAAEQSTPPEDLEAQARKRVYIALYQTHLPKLLNAGALDGDTSRVHATAATRALAAFVEEGRATFGGEGGAE